MKDDKVHLFLELLIQYLRDSAFYEGGRQREHDPVH